MAMIYVKLRVKTPHIDLNIPLDEFNLSTDEWNSLSQEQKSELVHPYVYAQNEYHKPCWDLHELSLIL